MNDVTRGILDRKLAEMRLLNAVCYRMGIRAEWRMFLRAWDEYRIAVLEPALGRPLTPGKETGQRGREFRQIWLDEVYWVLEREVCRSTERSHLRMLREWDE